MAIDYCSYHGQSAATWRCNKCDRYLGRCCVSNLGLRMPKCVLCASDLQSLGAANTTTPFWNVLHKFLAYPFKSSSLVLLVIVAVLCTQLSLSLVGLAIGFLILLISTRYAYAIIDEAAGGKTKPPGLSILFVVDEDKLFLKQIVVFIVMGAAVGVVSILESPFITFLATAFCTFALPASILILATDKSLVAAINPLVLSQLMMRLGIGYVVLYAFINILGSGPMVITNVVSGYVQQEYVLPVYALATVYFWFASAYMMGYTMLQYQEEIGYRADTDEDEGDQEETSQSEEVLRQVTILVVEGRFEEACDTLNIAVRKSPSDLLLQQRLNKILLAIGRSGELKRHSGKLIDRLVEMEMLALAVDVHENTLKCAPDFKLSAPEQLVKLARTYQDRSQYKHALALLADLTKRFPEYEDIGSAILQAARIYADQLNQPEKAIPLLRYILKSNKFDESSKKPANDLLRMLSR